MPPSDLPAIVDAGHAWAERQHAAGAPDTWLATWQEALRLGLVPEDPRHELASLCAMAARTQWRELRPGAPRNAGNRTGNRGRGVAGQYPATYALRCTPEQRAAWQAALTPEQAREALDRAAERAAKKTKRTSR